MHVEQVPLQMAMGQLESSLSRVMVWDDECEGPDEEDSWCATGQVIWVYGDGLDELVWWEELGWGEMLEQCLELGLI